MQPNEALSREVLKQAIAAEIDGQRFYTQLANRTSNKEAKRKLTNLAEDEMRHESILSDLYEKLYGEEVSDLPTEGVSVLSKFFRENADKEDLSEVQYIDLAIEAELAATKYYKEGALEAPNEDIKELYENMAAEEYSHFESLQAEKDALSGNYFWFGYDDSSPMEM